LPIDLVEGNLTIDKKQQLLMWICDLQEDEIALESMAEEDVADVVLLLYMVKKHLVTPDESELIAQAIKDVRTANIPDPFVYPESIDMRAFRITFIYTKFFKIFHSCLASAGMKDLQVS